MGVEERLCVAVPFPGFAQISVLTKEPKRLMETVRVVHSLLENSVAFKTIASVKVIQKESKKIARMLLPLKLFVIN